MLIRETLRRLIGYEWVERRLFEVLGGWSLQCADPALARVLATQSHHHAWHAQLWAERLPVLHDAAPDDVEVAASFAALVDPLTGAGRAEEGVEELVRTVLPALLQRYEDHLAEAHDVTDGPVLRALRLVIRDEQDDLRLLRRLLDGAEVPERAAGTRG